MNITTDFYASWSEDGVDSSINIAKCARVISTQKNGVLTIVVDLVPDKEEIDE